MSVHLDFLWVSWLSLNESFLLYYSITTGPLSDTIFSQSQSAIFQSLCYYPCFLAIPLVFSTSFDQEMACSLWIKFLHLMLINFQRTIFILDLAFFWCLSTIFFCFISFNVMNRTHTQKVIAVTIIVPVPVSISHLQEHFRYAHQWTSLLLLRKLYDLNGNHFHLFPYFSLVVFWLTDFVFRSGKFLLVGLKYYIIHSIVRYPPCH